MSLEKSASLWKPFVGLGEAGGEDLVMKSL